VPRARIRGEDGKVTEWKSKALRAYQRRTKQAEALIAGAYLSGTNTRRVRRALIQIRFSWDRNCLRKLIVVFVGFSDTVDVINQYADRICARGDGVGASTGRINSD
jgi:hypothetical protein